MHRRHFLLSSAVIAAVSFADREGSAMSTTSPLPLLPDAPREFYALRRYTLQMGPQTLRAETYFNEALVPALSRLGLGPIGAFKLDIGPETPAYYVLVSGPTADALTSVDVHLAEDEDFLKAATPFWAAPASTPAFLRFDTSLLLAFKGWPRLVRPSGAASHAKRIFQLRTYESPSQAAHIRKVEMFNHGEFEIFQRTGLHPVFFGDTLIGPRMPSLTYMLTFSGMAELEANWATFSADPAWKKLSTDPRYSYESIVSSITNLVLSPLSASQI